MAFSTSMSANTDEKNLSPIAQFAPWRRAGAKAPLSTLSTSSNRDRGLSQDEASSTDDGDDIIPTFVDFSDFTSDSEVSEDGQSRQTTPSNSRASLTTCVYSVMMLLRLRNAVCDDDDEPPVRYSSQAVSELPTPSTPKSKSTPKVRASGPCEEVSWWRASASEEESWWRPALPESSADSWAAQQRNRDPEEDESVRRAARSILNKLTVEKFEALFEQLVNCGFKQPHHISMLMHEVFEKATLQHHFIPMYAELCVKLEKDPRIVSVVEEAGALDSFRRLLLNECQSVFEQLFEPSKCETNLDEESAVRRKQQALGNMKLIGQLLVHGMLSSDLFVGCCEELLRKRATSPDALESLVALMMVAGPKFDKDTWQYYKRLQNILADMGSLTKDKSVPPRLRFLIRDVLDAREAGWPWQTARCKTAAPTTLEEVRSSAAAPASPDAKKEWTSIYASEKKGSPVASAVVQQKIVKAAPWRAKTASPPKEESDNAADVNPTAPPAAPAKEKFQAVEFRRALNVIFNDLASDKNIPGAVQRIREQNVPAECQADQYVDILTRIVEERRGAVRRCELAFIAGLSAAQSSAFERKECLAGIDLFFRDVYGGLCNEVHRLPAIMKSEFMPTMLNVFPAADLNKVVPTSMRK